MDINYCYLKTKLGKRSPLPQVETEKLIQDYRNGDQSAKVKIIYHNIPLVMKLARWYVSKGADFDDLVQEGVMGLDRAIEKYNQKKARFSTYATIWIKQYLRSHFKRDNLGLIHIPFYLLEVLRPFRKHIAENSKFISWNEKAQEALNAIAEKRNNPELVERCNIALLSKADVACGAGSFLPYLDDVKADENEPKPLPDESIKIMEKCLRVLTERELFVITNYYAIQGKRKRTLEWIGNQLGRTRERIRQIKNDALTKIRKQMQKEGRYGVWY